MVDEDAVGEPQLPLEVSEADAGVAFDELEDDLAARALEGLVPLDAAEEREERGEDEPPSEAGEGDATDGEGERR